MERGGGGGDVCERRPEILSKNKEPACTSLPPGHQSKEGKLEW